MHRHSCLTEETIESYYRRQLSEERALAATRHLRRCDRCARQLVRLRSFVSVLAGCADPKRLPIDEAEEEAKSSERIARHQLD